MSQKIKSVLCLSVDLSIFLANLSTDIAGAKIGFFVIFCVPENTSNLSACLSIFSSTSTYRTIPPATIPTNSPTNSTIPRPPPGLRYPPTHQPVSYPKLHAIIISTSSDAHCAVAPLQPHRPSAPLAPSVPLPPIAQHTAVNARPPPQPNSTPSHAATHCPGRVRTR